MRKLFHLIKAFIEGATIAIAVHVLAHFAVKVAHLAGHVVGVMAMQYLVN